MLKMFRILSVDNGLLKMKVKSMEGQVDQLKRASVDIQVQVYSQLRYSVFF